MEYSFEVKYTPEYLRGLTVDQLQELLFSAGQKSLELRTAKAQAAGYVEKPHLFKQIQKDIARIKTIIREKEANNARLITG